MRALVLLGSDPNGTNAAPVLRKGSGGEEVKRLQAYLGIDIDGDFGKDTRAAVMRFQEANGLDVDGVIGPDTRAALAGSGRSSAAVELKNEAANKDPVPSPSPDGSTFVPKYKATAYSKSVVDKFGVGSPEFDSAWTELAQGNNKAYGGLTGGIARNAGARNSKGELSAAELGRIIQDYKKAKVGTHFRSSPKAQKGIRNRIARERAMFDA